MLEFIDKIENNRDLILRDYLALERTKLANERTLFSYIRTSLYLLTAGIGIAEIKSMSHLEWLAWLCMFSGVILFFFGLIRFCRMNKYLKKYRSTPQRPTRAPHA